MKISNIPLYKDIKINTLACLMLCGLLSIASSILASTLDERCDVKNNYNYTLQYYSDRVSPIQEEAYLTIPATPATLVEIINAIDRHREAHPYLPLLLVLVTYNPTTQHYGQYLFASYGLLSGKLAQQQAPQLNDHLIKSPAQPLLWQVDTFLAQHPKLEVKQGILPKASSCCLPRGDMYTYLLGPNLPKQKEGYQGPLWPKLTPSAGVVSAFYRPCLCNEQHQLSIARYSNLYNLSHFIPHSLNLTAPPLDCTWIFGSQDELPLYAVNVCDKTSDILNITHITDLVESVAATSTVTTQHVTPNTMWVPIMGYLLLVSGYFHFALLILPPPLRYTLLRPPFMLITATLHLTIRIMS